MNAFASLPLFDQPPAPHKPLTLDEKFEKWVADNPVTVVLFVRFAQEAKRAGKKRYGIKAIAERVRWHFDVDEGHSQRGEDFYINNSYLSRLARLIVKRDPSLASMFEFRTLKS